MPDTIKSVSVYCGSQTGTDPVYVMESYELGALLGRAGYRVYYGGSQDGLMGALARGALAQGGDVVGVYPKAFAAASARPCRRQQILETATVMDRKAEMYARTQAAIVLPGGIGSLDEMFDRAAINDTHAILERDKPLDPVIICNVGGFYNYQWAHLQHSVREGFIKPSILGMFHMAANATEAVATLQRLDKAGPLPAGSLRP